MGKKGGSSQSSSNPKWLDDAGAELWNFAKDVVFNPNPAATPALSSTNSGGYPYAGQAPTSTGGRNAETPTGPYAPQPGQQSISSVYSPGRMSADNLRPLEQFPGSRVAGVRPNQKTASQLAANSVGTSTLPFDEGMGFARNATAGYGQVFDPRSISANQVSTNRFDQASADRYMNPFAKAALETTADEMARQAQILRLQNDAGMVSKGAFGGSRHGVVESNLNRDLLDRTGAMFKTGMSDAFDRAMSGFQQDESRLLQAGMANQGANLTADTFNEDNRFRGFEANRNQFNTERDRMLNAANTMGSLGTARSNVVSQDIERLLKTGEVRRQIDQQQIDDSYNRFVEQRDWPYTQLERLMGIINGNPSRGAMTTTQQPNQLAQTVGTGVSLASLFASDRRLKDNIRKVGEQDGIEIYEFTYKGSSTCYRGVMADQVKRVRPDAVIRREDGFDAVNYAAIGIPLEVIGEKYV